MKILAWLLLAALWPALAGAAEPALATDRWASTARQVYAQATPLARFEAYRAAMRELDSLRGLRDFARALYEAASTDEQRFALFEDIRKAASDEAWREVEAQVRAIFERAAAGRDTAELLAEFVAEEASRRSTMRADLAADVEMRIVNPRGGTARYTLRVSGLVTPQGWRSLTVVRAPADVEGVAILAQYEVATNAVSQWVHLPGSGRTKRLVAGTRRAAFLGSTYSYEDLFPPPLDQFSYRYAGQQQRDGESFYVLERAPRPGVDFGYSLQRMWVDSAHLRVRAVDLFDRQGALHKTLTLRDFTPYRSYWWLAQTLEMRNHVTGAATVSHWRNFAFNAGLDERAFDLNALASTR